MRVRQSPSCLFNVLECPRRINRRARVVECRGNTEDGLQPLQRIFLGTLDTRPRRGERGECGERRMRLTVKEVPVRYRVAREGGLGGVLEGRGSE